MTSPLCHLVDGLQSNTSGANARPASSSGASEQRICSKKAVPALKAASALPSSVKERTYLSNMGLGDSCITFNSQELVYDYILELNNLGEEQATCVDLVIMGEHEKGLEFH